MSGAKKDATPAPGQVNGVGVQDRNQSPQSTAPPPPAGVPAWAWERIAKIDGTRWAIPERDATGIVVGTAYRAADGSKTFKPGGKRGLIVAWPLHDYAGSTDSDPVFVCEGASDTGALMGMGLDAVGVPMAGHCGDDLAKLLALRHVCIIADADEAGRRGAQRIAGSLAARCASAKIIEPPEGAKDARAAVLAGAGRDDFLIAAGTAQPAGIVTAAANGSAAVGDPVILRLADVKPETVRWLWPGRIALGKLTLVAGDPGLGKSFLTLDIAARLSRGAPWPDAPGVPTNAGGVVILSAEDDPGDTIVPRLIAAGADLNRILAMPAIVARDNAGRRAERSVNLEDDLPALAVTIRAMPGCRLVVIDPISAYTGRVDSHRNAETRGLLAPLARLAADLGVAVVLVTHLNKSAGGKALYRAIGSIAFAAAARAAFAVAKDRDDPSRRLVLPTKNNLAPDGTGLAYRLGAAPEGDVPVVHWEPDPVDLSADEALGVDSGEGGGRSERDDAADWLREVLAAGSRPVKEIEADARAAGFSLATLRRARTAVGAIARKAGYLNDTRWELSLPSEGAQAPEGAHEGTHSPEGERLRTKPVESAVFHPKALTSERVSAFGEHLEPGRPAGIAVRCSACGRAEGVYRYADDPATEPPVCAACLSPRPELGEVVWLNGSAAGGRAPDHTEKHP